MNIKKIFKKYKLKDVFTPTTSAKLTYVKRDNIENDLEKNILIPGKQIVIYGHSGSGKTTLLSNSLKKLKRNYITTRCEALTTFDDLILRAFDCLELFYISEKTLNTSYSISSKLKENYISINQSIKAMSSRDIGQKSKRIVDPQLTAEKLAMFLGEVDSVWIIEDFHKVKEFEKKRIADVLKIFIDCANDYKTVKIICIGAVGTARELIEQDPNLNNRVAEVLVPLLKDIEIEKIILKGSKILNIEMESDLIEKIIYYSNNLASITHQICFDICFSKKIERPQIFPKKIDSESFKIAVNSFLKQNSDTFCKLYDKIASTDYGWYILKSFEYSEKEALSLPEIKHRIPNKKLPNSDDELLFFLKGLSSVLFDEALRYDKYSRKFSIASPFFRAFIKIKMASEISEIEDRKRKKKNKRNKKYEIKPNFKEVVFEGELLDDYHKLLDSFITFELARKKRQLDKNKNST